MKDGGEQLAVVVVDVAFVEHRGDPLRDAAADLAVDDRRIDDLAAVLDDEVARDRDRACLDVHLDEAAVRRLRPRGLGHAEVARRLESGAHPVRQ